ALSLLPELDRPARARAAIIELASGHHVVPRELVPADHATGLAHPDLWRGVGEERAPECGQRLQELRHGERAPATFLLRRRQKVAARRTLLRDSAQRKLADHLAGLN